jgi:phosphate transport system ATP-binding protein
MAGLFHETHENLGMSAMKLSGGQQQRLCIARALTVDPEILLLDEPCSALDIKNTANIEEMLLKFSKDYTIIIVTHNLSQAKRISDYTAFMLDGELVEFGETKEIFNNPKDKRTKEYIEGIYG